MNLFAVGGVKSFADAPLMMIVYVENSYWATKAQLAPNPALTIHPWAGDVYKILYHSIFNDISIYN